jgi:hypothetical protein
MLDTKTKTNATVKFTDANTKHRGYGYSKITEMPNGKMQCPGIRCVILL